ncbi:MAG TPA: ATP-binding protein [Actinomycetes bacterium]|nr:ATP-binding protein [Actinomycetes bacterium]
MRLSPRSRSEDYSRVELVLAEDLLVAGHAANDLAHLLAELIENAVSFSPPRTRVQISGQQAHSGHVIQIEDAGLGISEEELTQANQRLADPPDIDFALSQRLGQYVVGRLAQRHGIKVQLRHSWYGGVTALVLVPQTLLPQVDGSQPGTAEHAWSHRAVTGRAGLLTGHAVSDQPPRVRVGPPDRVDGDSTGSDAEASTWQATASGAERPPAGVRGLLSRFRTGQGDAPRATAAEQDGPAPARSSRGEHGATS